MSSEHGADDAPDNSNQPSYDDLLGENANAAGENTGAGASSSEEGGDPNTTGNDDLDLDSLKAANGKLRQQSGEQRKLFLKEMAENAPERLADLLDGDKDLRAAAEKQGIDLNGLRGKAADGMKPTDGFVSLAKSHNLNEAEAAKAFEKAKELRASGLSAELATKTAIEHFTGDGGMSKNVPTQGGSTTAKDVITGKVKTSEYVQWDLEKQRAYDQKIGNSPDSFLPE